MAQLKGIWVETTPCGWVHHPGRAQGLTRTEYRRRRHKGVERCACGKVKSLCEVSMGGSMCQCGNPRGWCGVK